MCNNCKKKLFSIFPSVKPVKKVSLWENNLKNPIQDDHIGFMGSH